MSRPIHGDRHQRFLFPPSVDEWVSEDHPVRFVADLVDALDLEALGFRMSPATADGRPHFAPQLLLGIWLYGWMERVRSARALEKAVQTQVPFMWVAALQRPDHVTLWRFFRDNRTALQKLFKKVVRVSADAGLVGFALHALDGTKLGGAGSMAGAQHRKTLEEALGKLDAVVAESVAAMEAEEANPPPDWKAPKELEDAKARRNKIAEALERLDAEETDHLHSKEPQARAVKTRDGVRLGYNAQAVVDEKSDLIVAVAVVNDAVDNRQLVPMVEQVAETLGKTAQQTVADTGYASGEQLAEAEKRHLPVLVKTHDEKSQKGEYAKSNFRYDRERDLYVCPQGEELPFVAIHKKTTGKPERRIYRCGNMECPVRDACTDSKSGREIKRIKGEDATVRQAELLADPKNKALYAKRKQIVEHVFGIVKWVDGFRRFTAWGPLGAAAQWSLVCLAINLRKLLPAVRDGRLSGAAFA